MSILEEGAKVQAALDDNYAAHVVMGRSGNSQEAPESASGGNLVVSGRAALASSDIPGTELSAVTYEGFVACAEEEIRKKTGSNDIHTTPSSESELAILDLARSMMPEIPRTPKPSDAIVPSFGVSRNAVATPPSFPTVAASVFDNRAIFEKFDPDTLFFIFYYQQGTYQQYLAARELKRQGWRFHKKYLTWFQRHEEPRVSTDTYETGTFVYFDYANVVPRGQGTGWCQRIKSEFVFEYRFLEDELV